jgi:hypothetical protein
MERTQVSSVRTNPLLLTTNGRLTILLLSIWMGWMAERTLSRGGRDELPKIDDGGKQSWAEHVSEPRDRGLMSDTQGALSPGKCPAVLCGKSTFGLGLGAMGGGGHTTPAAGNRIGQAGLMKRLSDGKMSRDGYCRGQRQGSGCCLEQAAYRGGVIRISQRCRLGRRANQ